MSEHNLIAVYDSPSNAEAAIQALEGLGVPSHDIQTRVAGTGEAGASVTPASPGPAEGFWDWLFGSDTPEADRAVYQGSLDRGGTVVSVRADSDERLDEISDVLEQYDPVNISERGAELGYTAPAMAVGNTDALARSTAASGEDSDTIQLAAEELAVGKRMVDRGTVRLRTRVIEQPVTEQVTLQNEEVHIERRPVTADTPVAADAFTEKTVVMTARGEEAVVGKTTRVVEEVALNKEASQRTETVSDTVRREEVDIDHSDSEGISKPDATVPR